MGFEYLTVPMIICITLAVIWSSIWKFLALWKSARKNQITWFVIFAVINTLGILEILYLFVFSKKKSASRKRK